MSIDPRFIIQMSTKSGPKDFVLLAGLLDLAHQRGLCGTESEVCLELSDPKEQFWVVRVTGRFMTENGLMEWSAYGDASPASSQMRGAYLRHAESRAFARMCRFATNIGTASVEELGPDIEEGGHGAGQPSVPVQPGLDGSVGSGVRGGSAASAPARAAARPPAAATNGQSTAGLRCTSPGCERYVTHLQRERSLEAVGDVLCPTCLQTRGAQV